MLQCVKCKSMFSLFSLSYSCLVNVRLSGTYYKHVIDDIKYYLNVQVSLINVSQP
jgi:hypothetical protein